MTKFIPVFPLGIVVFPMESVHLHIFEPRYKQLIRECSTAKKPFGIPVVLNNKLQDVGTLVHVTDVVQVYENGEMDIKIQGIKIFRSLEIIKTVPDKLYSGAIVNYPENAGGEGSPKLMQTLLKGMKEVHRLLNISKDFKKPEKDLR
jgi:Lon protease-like protein